MGRSGFPPFPARRRPRTWQEGLTREQLRRGWSAAIGTLSAHQSFPRTASVQRDIRVECDRHPSRHVPQAHHTRPRRAEHHRSPRLRPPQLAHRRPPRRPHPVRRAGCIGLLHRHRSSPGNAAFPFPPRHAFLSGAGARAVRRDRLGAQLGPLSRRPPPPTDVPAGARRGPRRGLHRRPGGRRRLGRDAHRFDGDGSGRQDRGPWAEPPPRLPADRPAGGQARSPAPRRRRQRPASRTAAQCVRTRTQRGGGAFAQRLRPGARPLGRHLTRGIPAARRRRLGAAELAGRGLRAGGSGAVDWTGPAETSRARPVCRRRIPSERTDSAGNAGSRRARGSAAGSRMESGGRSDGSSPPDGGSALGTRHRPERDEPGVGGAGPVRRRAPRSHRSFRHCHLHSRGLRIREPSLLGSSSGRRCAGTGRRPEIRGLRSHSALRPGVDGATGPP